MKLALILTASALLTGAMATPALACDMHGGGNWGFSGATWTPYNPQVSTMDPAMADEASDGLGSFLDLPDVAPVAKKKKPSFSSVAMRASARALAKRDAEEDGSGKAEVKKASYVSED